MTNTICLDENYSTTRLLCKIVNDECLMLNEDGRIKEECKWNINNLEFNIQNSKLIGSPEDKFETTLFLPKGENRKGEGGLRTKGYFKKSFEDKPLISVITVVYNGEKYLEETIQSVINQTYDNVEYIIIEGGSSDGTVDIIKKYEDKVDYWVSERDKGIYDAMNKGLRLSVGDWINFMNADDMFYSQAVIQELFHANTESADVLYGDSLIIDKNFSLLKKAYAYEPDNVRLLTSHNAFFIRASFYKIGYNISYNLCADLDLLYKILFSSSNIRVQKKDILISIFRLGGISSLHDFKLAYESAIITYRYTKGLKAIVIPIKIIFIMSLKTTLKYILGIKSYEKIRSKRYYNGR